MEDDPPLRILAWQHWLLPVVARVQGGTSYSVQRSKVGEDTESAAHRPLSKPPSQGPAQMSTARLTEQTKGNGNGSIFQVTHETLTRVFLQKQNILAL